MNNNEDNIDDLFDGKIDAALRALGFVFPRTSDDFSSLEKELSKKPIAKPAFLEDPLSFIGKRHFSITSRLLETSYLVYTQKFAQAAREGSSISQEIKKQMEEDKKKTRGNNSESK